MGDDELRARLAAPRIAVLGPPAIGGRPLAARPARVLAALVAASRPSMLEQLADAVWGDELPASHRAALHVHLGTLRRALAEVGAAVVRAGDTYALDPGPAEVDATLAVDLLEAGDPELVDAALGLWRGPSFAVDGDPVAPAAAHHLDAVRRDAEELRVELLLRSGDARAAEAAAREAVDAEPLREHRWGQLLRARYLAGRTAEALSTYQEARATLVDALGVEPGAELRDLEAAALTHDVGRLRLPERPDEPLGAGPEPTTPLVGRDEELARAVATLTATRRLAILGPPGVGKTRLAVEVARQLGDDRAWLDVGRAAAPLEWARRHPDGLVVLDGASRDVDAAASIIALLERSAPGVAILVTSRVPVPGTAAVERLGPLAPDDAALVLDAALEPGVTLDDAELAALAERAGGLPLALRLTAAAARTLPVATMLALPASRSGDEVDLATRAVLEVLAPVARTAFVDLAVLRGDFDLDLAAGVTGLDVEEVAPVVVDLADHGLLQARPDQATPYSLLGPLQAVGDRLLRADDREGDVRDRHARTCLARARTLAGLTESPDLEARLLADLPQHRWALEHLACRRDDQAALTLACHLDQALYAVGRWADKAELLDRALAIPGPPSGIRARAHALRARAGPLHLTDVAQAEQAEAMSEALGHRPLQAFARFVRSLHLLWEGRYAEAAELFHEVQQVFEQEGRSYQAHDALKFLGVALVLDGAADDGLEVQHEALARLRRDHPNPFAIAHGLAFLGQSHRLLGDDGAALADWTEGRTLAARIGNRATASHISIGLADLAVDRSDAEAALALTAEALGLIATGKAWAYAPAAWTVAVRAHLLAEDPGAAVASARRAVASLEHGPSGEAVRLGRELAALAMAVDDPVAAARLLGAVAATPDRRELPFPPPAEARRAAALAAQVDRRLGEAAGGHRAAGARCSLAEAAGRLLALSPA